jgi:4-aminobutyrate aminotransferase-like enzyme
VEQIAILIAARERAAVERRPAIAASGSAVARLACLVVQPVTGGGGVRAPR